MKLGNFERSRCPSLKVHSANMILQAPAKHPFEESFAACLSENMKCRKAQQVKRKVTNISSVMLSYWMQHPLDFPVVTHPFPSQPSCRLYYTATNIRQHVMEVPSH